MVKGNRDAINGLIANQNTVEEFAQKLERDREAAEALDDDHKIIGAPWGDVARIRQVFESEKEEAVSRFGSNFR